MDVRGVVGEEEAALAVAYCLLGSVCERGKVDHRDLHVRDVCDVAQDVLNVLLRDILCAIKGGAIEVKSTRCRVSGCPTMYIPVVVKWDPGFNFSGWSKSYLTA